MPETAQPGSQGTPLAGPQAPPQRFVQPRTAQAVVADATDPARRKDVLLRKRRAEGQEVNAWWLIGAFLVVSGGVVALMTFVPGG